MILLKSIFKNQEVLKGKVLIKDILNSLFTIKDAQQFSSHQSFQGSTITYFQKITLQQWFLRCF